MTRLNLTIQYFNKINFLNLINIQINILTNILKKEIRKEDILPNNDKSFKKMNNSI